MRLVVETTNCQSGCAARSSREQRGQQIHFADADGVNPDAGGVAVAPRHEAQELLAIALAILAGADRRQSDQRRADHEQREIDEDSGARR